MGLIGTIEKLFSYIFNLSTLKTIIMINYVVGGIAAVYEFQTNSFETLDFRIIFISLAFGLYGYILYYYD